jgi:O-antigen/teichoic acid export membrane protein
MIEIAMGKNAVKEALNKIKIFPDTKYRTGIINASYLTLGNILSQIIGLIGFLYIAKVLGSVKYGTYVTVVTFVEIFGLLTFTGLAKVIIREGSKKLQYFHRLLEETIGMRLYAIVFSILICCISSAFTTYTNYIKYLIIIFSVQLLVKGLTSFIGTIYQATENMKYMAYFSVLEKIIYVILSMWFLYLGFGVLTIILINLTSQIVTLLINYIVSRKFIKININLTLNIDKKIIKPAFIYSLIAFVSTLATKIDLLMVSFLSNPHDVGVYAVAFKISRQGSILRNMISVAFFPIVIKYFSNKKLKGKKLIKYSSIFLLSSLFICIVLAFFVEGLVTLVFGDNYSESGSILKLLLYYLVFSFYTIPFSLALQATGNEKIMLTVQCINMCLNIPLNIILYKIFGLIGIAYSTLIVYSTGSIILSLLTYKKLKLQGHIV